MSSAASRLTGAIHVIAGAIVGAGFLVASAAPATAHTALAASNPKDGGKIDKAPSQLLLNFTEPIYTSGYRIVVQGPDGHQYQAGTAQITGARLSQPLKPLGPVGKYRVEYRIVANDGHPLTSTMRFTLTKPGPAAGGAKDLVRPDSVYAVPTSTSVNNAPSWAPWIGSAIAVILAGGAVLFGRRATRGLD